jgi:acetoin utilization protein AcuB
MTIAEIMSPNPITVAMDDSLRSIEELFRSHHFHHVMVVSGRRLSGVISDRDVLRHVSPFAGTLGEQRRDEATLKMHAHQIMSRHPVTVSPQTDVFVAAEQMVEKRISCLPVVDEEQRLVGVVTWKDLLHAVVVAARQAGASAAALSDRPRARYCPGRTPDS